MCRVWGLGLEVSGVRLRVTTSKKPVFKSMARMTCFWGIGVFFLSVSGFTWLGFGMRFPGLGMRGCDCWSLVSVLGFWDSGFGFWILDSLSWILGVGFRVQSFRCRGLGFKFGVLGPIFRISAAITIGCGRE